MVGYDILFVGAGPSALAAVLRLNELGYKGNICILEKGKSLETRSKNEVISGVAGAGCYSDSKLSSALDVGGIIPYLDQEKLDEYCSMILRYFNYFSPKKINLVWDKTTEYPIPEEVDLKWNTHNTCHVGTENGQAIYYEIEKHIKSMPNIELITETEVIGVEKYDDLFHVTANNGITYVTKNLVLATGQKDLLPSKLISQFNLPSKPRAFQLGIRVEDIINDKYKDIIKANYDFKFVQTYKYDTGVSVRVRTFCCNSGNAHVCAENAKEGYVCFNGHAYKTPNPDNNTVNYGIMCEIEGLEEFKNKEDQISLMKKINAIPEWEKDNLSVNEDGRKGRKLLDGFEVLLKAYPQEVILSLYYFVAELHRLIGLDNAYYYYPEVKLNGPMPEADPFTFETTYPGLYMLGDCLLSRGIVKSMITGFRFAENFKK